MLESIVLGLHLASHHFPNRDYFENSNPGIYGRAENGLTAGVYRNTLGRTSVYGGVTLGDQYAVTLGVVSGYDKRPVDIPRCDNGLYPDATHPCTRGSSNHKWAPMIAPSVRLGPARVSIIPRIGDSASVVHLSVERKF